MPKLADTKDLPLEKRIEALEPAREVVKDRFKAERMKQLADFEKKTLNQKRRPTINERVMLKLDFHRRKGGKQAAIRAFGPYIVTKIDKDQIHCTIIREAAEQDQDGTVVRIDQLIPIGDRQCTPVYSSLDFAGSKKSPPHA